MESVQTMKETEAGLFRSISGNLWGPKILDVTMGQKYMQKQVGVIDCLNMDLESKVWRRRGGYTDYRKPEIQATFEAIPLRNRSLKLVLWDPPWAAGERIELSTFNSGKRTPTKDRLRKMLYLGWREIERVLEPSGSVILKWGSTAQPLSWVLSLKPRGLCEVSRKKGGRGPVIETRYIS